MSDFFVNRKVALCLLITLTLMSPGCLSLLSMRELMEDMKEDPKSRSQDTRVGWDYTFDTQDIESTEYTNESEFLIDPTVSQIEIFFDASIGDAISDFANETFPGLVEEVGARYVEISVWEPGEYPSGTPFFTERATENYEFTETYLNEDSSPFEDGEWILTVEARGIGIETPIDILSVYDSFSVKVTVSRPCVFFAEIHEVGECTDLIDLE
ncbi:MAG: hypothetical protein VYE51_00205 [Candidatus Thermoplasmatota archaeon]|nr:hypothetical protein [Euryarchaeota archaeon]MEC7390550.1 hypothetical protein [Candidatus Thermoplasmatota archaeon]MEC7543876.1 hypothetical protein [Candidatus Thermoplasmatota archaeon]MEC8383896.1 hypothetical protein [Candidatus Thermoplasmatota archaeon]MED5376283.1 hypothetical protein [Candidatus Thermoplasmatota archaeon]